MVISFVGSARGRGRSGLNRGSRSSQPGAKLLSVLSPKFRELARTDSLPDTSHGVKEERQIMVGQKDAGEHFSGLIKMPEKRACVTPANQTFARFVQRHLVITITRILNIQRAV